MSREFTGIIEKKDEWYIGYVEEIPGVNTQGKTLKEVKDNLKEALTLIIETNRELQERDRDKSQVIRESITVDI
jgi:predicted RNase H-like HicB family nuclease